MIDSDRITLDQIYGCNFKRVPLLYGEMEGTNPFQINETDEDLDSDKQIPDQPKQMSPTLQKAQLKPLIKTRQRQQTVHKSPVNMSQFEKHIGFRNSFYKNNNNKINLVSRQRVEEVKNQEIGMFTKYAQRFQLQKLQIWN